MNQFESQFLKVYFFAYLEGRNHPPKVLSGEVLDESAGVNLFKDIFLHVLGFPFKQLSAGQNLLHFCDATYL